MIQSALVLDVYAVIEGRYDDYLLIFISSWELVCQAYTLTTSALLSAPKPDFRNLPVGLLKHKQTLQPPYSNVPTSTETLTAVSSRHVYANV